MSDRVAIALQLEGARSTFRALVDAASAEDLARKSNGTRWTNRELLFHMLFGYRVVRALVPLVKVVSRLSPSIGRGFAALLNAGTRPFNFINYWGSVIGSRLYSDRSMIPMFDAKSQRFSVDSIENPRRASAARWPIRCDGILSSRTP